MDEKTYNDNNSSITFSMDIDMTLPVNYNEDVMCSICFLPVACLGLDYPYPVEEDEIWFRAETGNRCCECDEPTPINMTSPFVNWMPIEDVEWLLENQKNEIKFYFENALNWNTRKGGE